MIRLCLLPILGLLSRMRGLLRSPPPIPGIRIVLRCIVRRLRMDLRLLVLPSYRSAVEASNFLVGSLIAYHDLWIVQARWLLLNEWLCLSLLVGSCQTALYLPLFDRDDERRLFDALVISILNLLI